jgi:hypothetical protein
LIAARGPSFCGNRQGLGGTELSEQGVAVMRKSSHGSGCGQLIFVKCATGAAGQPLLARIGILQGVGFYTKYRLANMGTLPNFSFRFRKHLLHRAFDFWPYLFAGTSVVGLAYLFWPVVR